MKKLKKFISVILVVVLAFGGAVFTVRRLYPVKYIEYINECADSYGLDAYLVMSIIKAESNFEDSAVSHKNASGLMQITKGTANWIAQQLGVEDFSYERDIQNAEININMGTFYVSYLIEMYDGCLECALAAYNAGPNNVNKWLLNTDYSKDGKNLDKIPFPETERYLDKVKNNYKVYKLLYKKAVDGK